MTVPSPVDIPPGSHASAAPLTLPRNMSAAVREAYGGTDVVRVVERPVPVPSFTELLVRVKTVSSNWPSAHRRMSRPWTTRRSSC